MFGYYNVLAKMAGLCSCSIFLLSFIFQVYLNFKNKSTKGVSNLFVLGNFNICFFYACIVFCLDFPLVYKLMVPLYSLASFVFLVQNFYYSKFKILLDNKLLYTLNIFFIIIALAYIKINPLLMGTLLGWFISFAGIVLGLPQIAKIIKRKSVEGFSLGFVLVNLLGYIFDFVAGTILNFSAPVLFNSARGVITFLVFVLLFNFYACDEQKIWKVFIKELDNAYVNVFGLDIEKCNFLMPVSFYTKTLGIRVLVGL